MAITKERMELLPDRGIFSKLALYYGVAIALSVKQLINNSIDARPPGRQLITILIDLDLQNQIFTISDDARGMSKDEFTKCLVLAHSLKKQNDLGKVGFGLKVAGLNLGECLKIISKQINSPEEYSTEFNTKEWLANGSWFGHEMSTNDNADVNKCGTTIIIKYLRWPMDLPFVLQLNEELGMMFAPNILNNEIRIKINNELVVPRMVTWRLNIALKLLRLWRIKLWYSIILPVAFFPRNRFRRLYRAIKRHGYSARCKGARGA